VSFAADTDGWPPAAALKQ